MVDGPEPLLSTSDLSRRAGLVLRSWRSRRAARSCIIAWVQVPIRRPTRSRGESQGRFALLFAGASFSRHVSGARPASPPPGLTMGSRQVRVSRISPVGARALARLSRRRRSLRIVGAHVAGANPPHVALVARPRWRSLHRNAPTSDVPLSSQGTGLSTPNRSARFRSARLSTHGSGFTQRSGPPFRTPR